MIALFVVYSSTVEPYFLFTDFKNKFFENSEPVEVEIYDTMDAILPEMREYTDNDRNALELLLKKLKI